MSGTSKIAVGAMQTIEYRENSSFYTNPQGPFYIDTNNRGVVQLSFGYGYDLTAQGAPGIATLAANGIPQAVIDYLNQNGTSGATQQTVSDLNGLLGSQSEQDAAQTIFETTFNYDKSQLSGVIGVDASTLADGVQTALADVAYNGGLVSKAFGPNLVSDIQAGNYGAAAYELAYNTAAAGQNGYENRVQLDAAIMLGFDPSVTANEVLTFAGSPSITDVTEFINNSTSLTGVGSSYIAQPGGFALLNQAIQYEISTYTSENQNIPGSLPNVADIMDNTGGTTVYISDPGGYDQVNRYSSNGDLISQTKISSGGGVSVYKFDSSTGDITEATTVDSDGTTTRVSLQYDNGTVSEGTYSSFDSAGNEVNATQ